MIGSATRKSGAAKSPAVLLVVGLLSTAVGACGGAGKSTGVASGASSNAVVTNARKTGTAGGAASVPWWLRTRPLSVAVTRRLLGNPKLEVGAIGEDGRIFASYYGYLASPADARAITAVAKRYYALAAAGDGRAACAMLAPNVAREASIVFGRGGGRYLHGAKTCQAVVARMFAHRRSELTEPVTVTGALVRGARGYALLISRRMPSSMLALRRERGVWVVAEPLGGIVPVAK